MGWVSHWTMYRIYGGNREDAKNFQEGGIVARRRTPGAIDARHAAAKAHASDHQSPQSVKGGPGVAGIVDVRCVKC